MSTHQHVTTAVAALFAGLLALSTGCHDTARAVGALPSDSPPTTPGPIPSAFPALSRSGDSYEASGDIYAGSNSYHGGYLASRYVLYADTTFTLQFSSPRFGFFEYAGRYARTASQITLNFAGWSVAGPWEARGTLRGDTLAVAYNTVMMMSDFVDGAYVREPRAP